MTKIGTTFTKSGKKAVLCGSGELGKEVAIELQRYGVQVVALDKYANAPAMHIAHSSHVLPMLDGHALKQVIEQEKPDFIIPEIEAIATDKLVELEEQGYNVVPREYAVLLLKLSACLLLPTVSRPHVKSLMRQWHKSAFLVS